MSAPPAAPPVSPALQAHEPTRARYPDEEGYVERGGVRTFYEVYGTGGPTVLLLPSFAIAPSRMWKAQIPYLARHFRVVAFDGRGTGRSERPRGSAAYGVGEYVADALAVMDATGTGRAVLAGLSMGTQWELVLAATHPQRVAGAVFVGPYLPLTKLLPLEGVLRTFERAGPLGRARGSLGALLSVLRANPGSLVSPTMRLGLKHSKPSEAARKFNRHYWLEDWRGFLEWFARINYIEPHSARQIETLVEWGLQSDPQTAAEMFLGERLYDPVHLRELCSRVRCPVLVIHGDVDIVNPPEWGAELARATRGELVRIPDAGHGVLARKPVAANLAMRRFIQLRR